MFSCFYCLHFKMSLRHKALHVMYFISPFFASLLIWKIPAFERTFLVLWLRGMDEDSQGRLIIFQKYLVWKNFGTQKLFSTLKNFKSFKAFSDFLEKKLFSNIFNLFSTIIFSRENFQIITENWIWKLLNCLTKLKNLSDYNSAALRESRKSPRRIWFSPSVAKSSSLQTINKLWLMWIRSSLNLSGGKNYKQI